MTTAKPKPKTLRIKVPPTRHWTHEELMAAERKKFGYPEKEVGDFGKVIKPHHHKTAIKKAHTHILGVKPRSQKVVKQVKIKQPKIHPGIVPRNVGLYTGLPSGHMVGSLAWFKEMDQIVKKYTGWNSLQEMCQNRPTLRVSKHASANESQAIYMMRIAYKFVTGREAHPEENWDAYATKR